MNMSAVPLVIIEDSPFRHPGKVSYGVVLRARDTGRYLIVSRKDPTIFVCLCRGKYHRSRMAEMILGSSREEVETMRDMMVSVNSFREMCEKVDSNVSVGRVDIAYQKLVSMRSFVETRLAMDDSNVKRRVTEDVYHWPKGCSQGGETPTCTALRELEEETGVDLSREGFEMSSKTATRVFYTLSNAKYTNVYYFCSTDKEVAPCPRDVSEVSDCKWVTYEELIDNRMTYVFDE